MSEDECRNLETPNNLNVLCVDFDILSFVFVRKNCESHTYLSVIVNSTKRFSHSHGLIEDK